MLVNLSVPIFACSSPSLSKKHVLFLSTNINYTKLFSFLFNILFISIYSFAFLLCLCPSIISTLSFCFWLSLFFSLLLLYVFYCFLFPFLSMSFQVPFLSPFSCTVIYFLCLFPLSVISQIS
jgi:hypothetical protein